MRAFLSHSSVDKKVVTAVHGGLEKESTWLDSAEIEWGALFLERIAAGIEAATDFVLFWSASAAKSEWVRIELNMSFRCYEPRQLDFGWFCSMRHHFQFTCVHSTFYR